MEAYQDQDQVIICIKFAGNFSGKFSEIFPAKNHTNYPKEDKYVSSDNYKL